MKSTDPSEAAPTVVEALQQNQQATSEVQKAADDLAVVHAVLHKTLPGDPHTPDVGEAVRQADRIEKKLQKTVDKLEQVNELLERQAATGA